MTLWEWLHDLFRPTPPATPPESIPLPEKEHPRERAAEQAVLEKTGKRAQMRLERLETIARAQTRRMMKTRK
jgi:hypothetical protein